MHPTLTFSLTTWDEGDKFVDIITMLHHPEVNADKAVFVMKRVRLDIKTKIVELEDWSNQQCITKLNTLDLPVIKYDCTRYEQICLWLGLY